MGKREKQAKATRPAASLVRAGGKTEKRLLRREHEAEQALNAARARMRKAQDRLERRLSAVADAEAILRGRQHARTIGPIAGLAVNGDGMVALSGVPETSGNGAVADSIDGLDVAVEQAAIETGGTAQSAATTAAPKKRPARAKATAKDATLTPPPAEPVAPTAAKPAPKRSRQSRAAKTTGGAS